MSAWLVSEDHINVMITWAMDNGVFLPGMNLGTPGLYYNRMILSTIIGG